MEMEYPFVKAAITVILKKPVLALNIKASILTLFIGDNRSVESD